MMKSRVVLLSSLLLAMLIPLMVLGSSGCGRGTDTPKNEVWTRQFGTLEDDNVHAMVADELGNIYMAGGTGWPGQSSYLGLGIEQLDDTFIAKYDASGNEVWTRQFGTSGNDLAYAMVADGSGNIYVAGGTEGSFPGQTSSGGVDAFIAKYDTSGNEIWTTQFGTGDFDVVRAMVADGSGNMYVTGKTGGDVFIMKLRD